MLISIHSNRDLRQIIRALDVMYTIMTIREEERGCWTVYQAVASFMLCLLSVMFLSCVLLVFVRYMLLIKR